MKSSVWPILIALVVVLALLTSGWQKQEQIRHYEVSKPQPDQRLLGAIVPHGDRAWFFKATGPQAALEPLAGDFAAFVKSLKFGNDPAAPPQWTLPSGWKQKEAAGFRFATIELPSTAPPLDISVTQLPMPAGDRSEYLLSNLNLWREQMGLQPLDASQLSSSVTNLRLSDDAQTTAMLVDVTGYASRRAGHGQIAPAASATPVESPKIPLRYFVPEGWQEGQRVISRGGIAVRRDAAFEVKDGDKRVEITITSLPAASNPVLSNVNRWRRQIQLEDIDQEELAKEVTRLPIGELAGEYLQLTGRQETILGVIVVRQETAWFIKLQGDTQLAKREQKNFEAFAKSLRFE